MPILQPWLRIDDIADMYKYNIVLANSDENDEKEINVVNTLFSKQVDGIIFMGYHLTDKLWCEFSRSRTPIVLAGTGRFGTPIAKCQY